MPDKAKLIAAINRAESSAYGSELSGDLGSIRARSIEDYLGEPYGDEVEGQSQVVSRDVFDTIEWIKPSLMRIFTGGERVCRFDPVGPEDEEQAEQETDYINHVIQEKNDWFRIFLDWSSDALLTKNAYALAYWDKDTQVEKEHYSGLADIELAMLLQDPEVELIAHSQYPDRITAMAVPQMQGQLALPGMQPMAMPPQMLHDVDIKRTRTRGHAHLCVLPPERCKISEHTPNFAVKDSNYFEYWDLKTVSELREMGLQVEPMQSGERDADTVEDAARDQLGESREDEGSDPAMKRLKCRMIWIRHDYNEDGIAELLFCIRIGNEIHYLDECNEIPVACMVPVPLPHRHMGLSLRDIMTDLQRIKTVLLRQVLNNMYLANNGRYGISSKVNLDDMLVSRAGGVVRVDGVPGQEIFPFNHPFIAQHGIGVMEYVDQIRQARTGTSATFTGVDPNALNKSHSGIAIAQLTSMAGQRVELVARVFAEGVKDLFRIVHELTIKHADVSRMEQVRMRGKWVAVDPSNWKRRQDLKIAVGLGTGNKEAMGANLLNILALQEKGLAIGVATPKKIFHSLAELTKNYGFPNAEAFWQEPPENAQYAPPDPLAAEKAKAEADAMARIKTAEIEAAAKERTRLLELQAEGVQDARAQQAETIRSAGEASVKQQTEVAVARIDASAKVAAENLKIQHTEALKNGEGALKSFVDAANQIIERAAQSREKESLAALMSGMQALVEVMGAPREVLRDPKTREIIGSVIKATKH